MNPSICVAGWYYFPPWLAELYVAKHDFPVEIIGHRCDATAYTKRLFPHYEVIQNIGLEFHCYDHFLKTKWEGEPVLFCQDDIYCGCSLTPLLHYIFSLKADFLSVFRDEEDAEFNCGIHGRMFVCSSRFLSYLLERGGFPFDEANTGQIYPREGVEYNQGVNGLKSLIIESPFTPQMCFVPELTLARRGLVDYPKVGNEGRAEWLQSLRAS